jgi:hypothetical protein
VSVSTTAPVRDTAATFTPVRKPGSSPITTFSPPATTSRSCSRLRPKMRDRLLVRARLELQAQLHHDRRREQPLVRVRATSAMSAARRAAPTTRACIERAISSTGASTDHARNSSASPRRMASTRCDGHVGEPLARSRSSPGTWRPRPPSPRRRVLRTTPLARVSVAHRAAQLGVLRHALGQHVARALQRVGDVATSRDAST